MRQTLRKLQESVYDQLIYLTVVFYQDEVQDRHYQFRTTKKVSMYQGIRMQETTLSYFKIRFYSQIIFLASDLRMM